MLPKIHKRVSERKREREREKEKEKEKEREKVYLPRKVFQKQQRVKRRLHREKP